MPGFSRSGQKYLFQYMLAREVRMQPQAYTMCRPMPRGLVWWGMEKVAVLDHVLQSLNRLHSGHIPAELFRNNFSLSLYRITMSIYTARLIRFSSVILSLCFLFLRVARCLTLSGSPVVKVGGACIWKHRIMHFINIPKHDRATNIYRIYVPPSILEIACIRD